MEKKVTQADPVQKDLQDYPENLVPWEALDTKEQRATRSYRE